MGDTLREEVLERLVQAGGYMIVYTHLGKNNGPPYLSPATVRALRSLGAKNRAGSIWVPTTSRILRYYVNKKYLKWTTIRTGNETSIVIQGTYDPVRGALIPDIDALRGLTFYVDDPENTEIILRGQEISEVVMNEPDASGRRSIMIPLQSLPSLDATMATYRSKGYF